MTIVPGRVTADYDGSLVVFIIGMRINRLWKIGRWLPVLRAMPRMLAELGNDAGSGFLGADFLFRSPRSPVLVQYWRDFQSLERYARAEDAQHRPAWRAFNAAAGRDGSVGIYHETYIVERHGHETIYANMPSTGLGKVTGTVPATGHRSSARQRLER